MMYMSNYNKEIQNHRIFKNSSPDLSEDFVYYYSRTFAPFFLQINMNFTCRIFPLSCFCEKKKKEKYTCAIFSTEPHNSYKARTM